MASMSVSGVVSGMDWDSMIDEIITNAAKPAQVKVNKKTNLTNKKSLFEEMKVTMNSLQSSLSPLKLPSTYKAKTIDIERIDTSGSYKGVLTATVNADAEVNVWDLKVNQLATAQVNRSKQITSSSLSSTLNGLTSSTMYINMGGQKVGIEVNATDTLQTLKSRINNTLKTLDNPLAVTASVVDNKLILKSDNTGLGTRTATETINYSSTGVNRLSNIAVTSSEAKNLKITKGSTSYTYGTDFTVANGNEIRWKQYDRSDEVALNDTVSVKYRMAAGDVYENTGTYGDSEAAISGFTMADNGTLASRVKIRDDDGNEYVYGKDFTLDSSGKVEWIEAPEDDDTVKTNEPDSYTVKYTKNIPVETSKTYTKGTATNEPDSYTVSYDKTSEGSYNVTGTKVTPVSVPDSYTVSYDKVLGSSRVTSSGTTVDFQHPTSGASGSMPTYVEFQDTYGLSVASAPTRIDFDSSNDDKIEVLESGSVGSYSYVTDFIIRKASYGNNNPADWNNHAVIEWRSSNRPSGEYTVRYTHTYSAASGDSSFTSDLSGVFTEAGTDTANITITGSDGTVYEQGTHYNIKDGKIVWQTQEEVTDLTMSQFAELQAQYQEGTGSELATKTLIDGDGVIRTYVDPEDTSLFNMSAGGKDYVYGRDYVLRVNDSGTGYRFDWLVDDSNTIADANTSVSTYAAYRNISTETWQKAPDDNTAYTFDFAGSHDTTITADVTSSQSDKTLSGILGETVTDTTKVSITDSSGNVCTDYTISGDTITWTGTTPSTDDTFDITSLQAAYYATTGDSTLPTVTLTDSEGVLRTYLDIDASTVNFQLSDASGNAYTYGRDYVFRVSDDGQGYVVSWALTGDSNSDGTVDIKDANPAVAAYTAYKDISTSEWKQAPSSGNFTFSTTYTKSVTYSGSAKSADTDKSLTKIFGTSSLTAADYGSVTIDGYTQGKDFVINSEGVIRWLDQNSKTPDAYKAVYKFSDTYSSATASNISASGSSINVNGVMPSLTNMGVKTFVGDKLNGSTSYNYVDEAEGKAAFTLTDSAGNTYEYGKDFAVRCSSLTSTSLQLVMPNNPYWPSSFSNQSGTRTIPTGETLRLTYNNTATRFVDSTDDLSAGLGFTPSDWSKLTLTDADGNEYTEDVDYELDRTTGKVTWFENDSGEPNSYTINYKSASWSKALGSNGYVYDTSNSFGYNYDDFAALTGSTSVTSGSWEYLNLSDDENLTVTIGGVSAVYGQNYVLRKNANTTDNNPGCIIFETRPARIADYQGVMSITPDPGAKQFGSGYTNNDSFSLNYAITATKGSSNEANVISDFLSEYSAGSVGADEITVTSRGTTYTYNPSVTDEANLYALGSEEFAIIDGAIRFKPATEDPKHPAEGVGYTLIYEAFSALEAEGTYDGSSTQEASITVDSGYGKYGDTSLSYEQILSDLELSSSSNSDTVAEKFAENFTLTDGTTTFTYGTDYTIIQGSDEDATSGQHNVLINWISGGTKPSSGAAITLTYTGRGEGGGEALTTAGVQRSAKDTIYPSGSSVTRDLYSTFSSASEIRITDGTESYFLGQDFTISQSTDGLNNPVINWNSDSEWFNQDTTSASNFTLYVTGSAGTTTYSATRAAGSDELSLDLGISYPSASDFEDGTTTIIQGNKTFYENEDFMIMDDADGNAQVYWLNDRSGGSEWYYPNPGTMYTINHTDSSGNTTTYNASRSSSSSLSMADYGMTTANGSLTVQYGDKAGMLLDAEPDYDDDGNAIANTDGHAAIKAEYSIDITDRGNGSYTFNWVTPTLTARTGLPSFGDELTVEYEYDANTFEVTGEAATLLGLNDDVTEAQDAELVLDGETIYRASNDIGADYDNELIKGVTIHLKGTGEVSLDIAHDAEKAVESIQTFVDTYNDLMSWMNTRMTESQVDEDTAATIDSDDFRMRWGLLHGNSLLRQTKSQMRNLTSQNFTFSFTQRKSSEEIYGTMGYNGLKSSSTLRLRIGTKYVDVTIDPTDTLQTIVAKINDDTKGGPMNDIYYDDEGNKLQAPLLRASVENDMLVINSTSSDEITMSGSAAMNALKMNYTYKGLYQIGIETTSDDYGKSGELVFDTEEFMTALEDNPDEVQALMLKFVDQFSSWTKSMLNSSASGETSGTLTREIENIQTQIDDINEYLENYQDRLDRMEEQLRTKYGNTETQLSRLTQQASSIAAILNQLNGTASNSSSSS